MIRDIKDRVIDLDDTNWHAARVKWDPIKSIFWLSMTCGWFIGGTLFFSWSAVLFFLFTCILTLCGGHSLGMHRKLIHDSFDCPKWMERLGVYLGTLVGLGGPFTMMKTHDMRDWAQRQERCHPYFSHGSHMVKDFWWQVHCRLEMEYPPHFQFPNKLTDDAFMKGLQRTAFLQHVIIGVIFYTLGGWGFVSWGLCGRVIISIFGHWLIGYYAHNHGHQDWIVEGASVQGHNVRYCGLFTFGECWHNNHHAFPESAKLGLYKGQIDPGWWVLKGLQKIGLVRGLTLPQDLPVRKSLKALNS